MSTLAHSRRLAARGAYPWVRSSRHRVALVLGIMAALGVARAAPAEPIEPPLPADPTLTRLIANSLAARPEIAQSRALAGAAQEQVSQAGALPDPMLQLGIQNDGFTSIEIGRMDTSFVQIMASQAFPWHGKRGLRAEVAGLGAAQARQAVARLQLTTEAEVRRAYLDLLLMRDRLALLDALAAIWQNAQGVARARYVAGDGAQSDMLRAQLEIDRLRQRRLALGASEASRVQLLNRLRAHPLDEAIEAPVHLRDLIALTGLERRFAADRAVAHSPELAAARLGIAGADRTVALAGKSAYPDLTVSTGVMIRGALPPMWTVTVAGPLPVFHGDKQRREVAEGAARARAARSEAEAIEQLIRLRVAERRTAFTALVATLDLYQRGLLVQSQATTESTLAQYKVGKVSFASVLEANAGYIADQDGFLESVAAAHRLLIADAEISLEATAMPAEPRP